MVLEWCKCLPGEVKFGIFLMANSQVGKWRSGSCLHNPKRRKQETRARTGSVVKPRQAGCVTRWLYTTRFDATSDVKAIRCYQGLVTSPQHSSGNYQGQVEATEHIFAVSPQSWRNCCIGGVTNGPKSAAECYIPHLKHKLPFKESVDKTCEFWQLSRRKTTSSCGQSHVEA